MIQAQRTTAQHTMGDEYEFAVNIGAEYYQQLYNEELLPAIKEKMPWLKSGGGAI